MGLLGFLPGASAASLRNLYEPFSQNLRLGLSNDFFGVVVTVARAVRMKLVFTLLCAGAVVFMLRFLPRFGSKRVWRRDR